MKNPLISMHWTLFIGKKLYQGLLYVTKGCSTRWEFHHGMEITFSVFLDLYFSSAADEIILEWLTSFVVVGHQRTFHWFHYFVKNDHHWLQLLLAPLYVFQFKFASISFPFCSWKRRTRQKSHHFTDSRQFSRLEREWCVKIFASWNALKWCTANDEFSPFPRSFDQQNGKNARNRSAIICYFPSLGKNHWYKWVTAEWKWERG